ncbi:hypothetical protein FPOAC2_10606 [Fusarium poae]|jgi:cation transport ATPase
MNPKTNRRQTATYNSHKKSIVTAATERAEQQQQQNEQSNSSNGTSRATAATERAEQQQLKKKTKKEKTARHPSHLFFIIILLFNSFFLLCQTAYILADSKCQLHDNIIGAIPPRLYLYMSEQVSILLVKGRRAVHDCLPNRIAHSSHSTIAERAE